MYSTAARMNGAQCAKVLNNRFRLIPLEQRHIPYTCHPLLADYNPSIDIPYVAISILEHLIIPFNPHSFRQLTNQGRTILPAHSPVTFPTWTYSLFALGSLAQIVLMIDTLSLCERS